MSKKPRRRRALGKIDQLDLKILGELVKDSSVSIPKLAKTLGENTSVVYSRVKRMVKRGLIKRYTLIVNDLLLGYTVGATVCVKIDARARESVIKALSGIPNIYDIREITGRYDIIFRVKARDLKELHDLVAKQVAVIEGVSGTETFVELLGHEKEIVYSLPS
jgi:Lrp/AsnC family transcriptional regulator for asnA, asnC and gidA